LEKSRLHLCDVALLGQPAAFLCTLAVFVGSFRGASPKKRITGGGRKGSGKNRLSLPVSPMPAVGPFCIAAGRSPIKPRAMHYNSPLIWRSQERMRPGPLYTTYSDGVANEDRPSRDCRVLPGGIRLADRYVCGRASCSGSWVDGLSAEAHRIPASHSENARSSGSARRDLENYREAERSRATFCGRPLAAIAGDCFAIAVGKISSS
jgi:hypothetical protein